MENASQKPLELILARNLMAAEANADRDEPGLLEGIPPPARPFDQSATHGLGRAGVDVDGRSALLVGDEIGVREPARMHAPLDQHAGNVHRRSRTMPGGGAPPALVGLLGTAAGPRKRPHLLSVFQQIIAG